MVPVSVLSLFIFYFFFQNKEPNTSVEINMEVRCRQFFLLYCPFMT